MLPDPLLSFAFYVHTHGKGHAMRVSSIIRNLDHKATVMTSFATPWQDFPENAGFISLPSEDLEKPSYKQPRNIPRTYHYLPLGVSSVAERYAIMSNYISNARPALVFVDVSVEVAHMIRLCGTPVAIPRMHGSRNDEAHLGAYDLAAILVAPFPEWAEQEDTPSWVIQKTVYTGALCRFYDQELKDQSPHDKPFVLILTGGCADIIDLEKVNSWARDNPELDWIILGNYQEINGDELQISENLLRKQHVDNVSQYLQYARYVVAPCSDNITAEIAFFGKPWICLPFDRPFDEQLQKAKVLERENIAVVAEDWPNSSMISYLMSKADTIDIEKQKQWVNPLAAKAIAKSFYSYLSANQIAEDTVSEISAE